MSNSLQAFLHPIEVENKKVVVSERFQEAGKPIAWEIRPITEKENNQLMKKCTKRDKSGNEQFNRSAHAHALAAASVVFPDLTDAELQKGYGVAGEAELLQAMLHVGEFATLMNTVNEVSGLDEDINEEIEAAKNS